jgi:GDPmannose 4,6-dehydratase
VTRKITSHVARIKKGLSRELRLGNIEARRDWGHARDYVEAMWLMLQKDSPEDYVIGTGQGHSVREFLEIAFGHVGLDYQKYVVIDPTYYRPAEIYDLLADASKAKEKLGWTHRYRFEDLVKEMTEREMYGPQSKAFEKSSTPFELPIHSYVNPETMGDRQRGISNDQGPEMRP